MFRFIEISNLILISINQVIHFYESVHFDLLVTNSTLGDFTNWMPLYVIYTYLTLGRKKGLIFSVVIFLVKFSIGVQVFPELNKYPLDSLLQFYLANVIYIVAFYYAQFAFGIYSELNIIKTNAYMDALTGIPNRRKLSLNFDQLWETARKENRELSVIIIDIDDFKQINDQYGHDVGDLVLKEFSSVINNLMTDREIFGRWGGEEFLIISQASEKEMVKVAELLQNTIVQHPFIKVQKVTASFGVSSFQTGDSKEDIFKRADIALYQSKKNGKNQVNKI